MPWVTISFGHGNEADQVAIYLRASKENQFIQLRGPVGSTGL